MLIPYVGFGNDELKQQPIVHAGDAFLCKKCGKLHELEGGFDKNGNVTELLLFYKCDGKDFIAAIANKLVIDVKPSVSGKI